jgi:hypothetical protein
MYVSKSEDLRQTRRVRSATLRSVTTRMSVMVRRSSGGRLKIGKHPGGSLGLFRAGSRPSWIRAFRRRSASICSCSDILAVISIWWNKIKKRARRGAEWDFIWEWIVVMVMIVVVIIANSEWYPIATKENHLILQTRLKHKYHTKRKQVPTTCFYLERQLFC